MAFAAAMCAFEAITAASYGSIGGQGAVSSVFGSLGTNVQRLLKIEPSLMANFGLANYLAFGYFHPVFLGLGAAFVTARASDAIAGEIERGTLLFVLARPIARSLVLLSKVAEVVLGAAVLVVAAWCGTVGGLALGRPAGTLAASFAAVDLSRFALIGLQAFALLVAMGGIGFVASALPVGRAGNASGIASATVLVAFSVDFVAGLFGADALGLWSPFHYYAPQTTLTGNVGDALLNVAVLLAMAATLIATALLIFTRRDIA